MESTKVVRNSGIELMKVIAIVLIILSHVVQTLHMQNHNIYYSDYIIDLSLATTDLNRFILSVMQYSGALGNNIFLVCSAWFLLDSSKLKMKKIWNMILEIWVVSVLILMIMLLLSKGTINPRVIIQSLFPTTFNNNWYLTCYILFYPLHTTLNRVINQMEQRTLLKVTSALVFLYCICNFFKASFFATHILVWITIYFIVAYVKKYLNRFNNNVTANIWLLMFGLAGNIALIFVTNFLGLHIDFLGDKILHWNRICSPFLIATAIALLNIGRKLDFKNSFINSISHLSLLIYIIHENIIICNYVRPFLWESIYLHFGYDYILFWVFVMVAGIFAASLILSFLYEKTIQRLVLKISPKIYSIAYRIYKFYEDSFIKIS